MHPTDIKAPAFVMDANPSRAALRTPGLLALAPAVGLAADPAMAAPFTY
jgi:hypothetical protein